MTAANFDGAYQHAEDWYNATPKIDLINWAHKNGVDIGLETSTTLHDDWASIVIEAKAKATREYITQRIERETQYDAETVAFEDDGTVSAIKDANKTFNGPHEDRLMVGSIAELLAA